MTENIESKSRSDERKLRDLTACQITAGLIVRDRNFLIIAYLLLLVPRLIAMQLEYVSPAAWFQIKCLERILGLIILYQIGSKLIADLSSKVIRPQFKSLLTLLVWGLMLWFILLAPLELTGLLGPSASQFGALLLIVPAAVISYVYFFYFVPPLLNVRSPTRLLRMARLHLMDDRLLPIKVMLAPLGLSYALQALISVPSPDARDAAVAIGLEILTPLPWLLSSYIGLAYSIIVMPEAVWHQSGLDPYRKSRLTTLAIQGQGWFSKVLKPSSGFQLMLLSILLWGANYGRLINTPPSPKINVEKVALSGEEIKLTLSLKDERYHYRGFLPLQFRLAGPQGTVISRFPESVKIPDTDRDLRFGLPKSAEETRLEVKFISSKDAADTKQLQDLYLWYAGTKVALLDMNKAVMRN